jgi:hypothetical protein
MMDVGAGLVAGVFAIAKKVVNNINAAKWLIVNLARMESYFKYIIIHADSK